MHTALLFDCDDVDADIDIAATGPLRGYLWFPITWGWNIGYVNASYPYVDRSGLGPIAHTFDRESGGDLGRISGDIEGTPLTCLT